VIDSLPPGLGITAAATFAPWPWPTGPHDFDYRRARTAAFGLPWVRDAERASDLRFLRRLRRANLGELLVLRDRFRRTRQAWKRVAINVAIARVRRERPHRVERCAWAENAWTPDQSNALPLACSCFACLAIRSPGVAS